MQNEANFAEKKVKILILHFIMFECLKMHDIADYDSTIGSGLLRNHELPVSMA